jgi:hypothetical protein
MNVQELQELQELKPRDPERPIELWVVRMYHPSGFVPRNRPRGIAGGSILEMGHGNCPCNVKGPVRITWDE